MDIKKALKESLTIKFDQAFGLDISDRSIEVIEMEKFFRFKVITYGWTELPSGIVDNGKILDQANLALKLKTLLKETKPKQISTNKVIISLPESQVFVQCLVLDAKLKSEELSKAITDKVSTISALTLDKMYWDFLRKPLPDKTKQLIIFIGVPKDIALGYVRFCNSIGLEVVSLNVESLSSARAILKKSDRQSLIIDIGGHFTTLSFFDSNDKINMSLVIPLAGDNFTEAIKNDLKIETSEAEDLKKQFGFRDDPANKVRPIMLPILTDILKETAEAIKYYEETFKQKLDDIYLLGGSSLLPDVITTIKSNLGREVRPVSNSNNINLNFLANKEKNFPLFASVVGLGMVGASGEFQDINLLKKMPKGEINSIDKLNLFKLGYLSPVNTVRTIINNKYVLVTLIILIGIIFAILLQQVKNYGL